MSSLFRTMIVAKTHFIFSSSFLLSVFVMHKLSSSEKVSKLTKWLKEIPTANIDRQSCGAEVLDEEVVAQIQTVVKTFMENPPESKRLKLQVKPHVVYKVNDCYVYQQNYILTICNVSFCYWIPMPESTKNVFELSMFS